MKKVRIEINEENLNKLSHLWQLRQANDPDNAPQNKSAMMMLILDDAYQAALSETPKNTIKVEFVATYHGSTQTGWIGDPEHYEFKAGDLAKAKAKSARMFADSWRDGSATLSLRTKDNEETLPDAMATQTGKTWKWQTY